MVATGTFFIQYFDDLVHLFQFQISTSQEVQKLKILYDLYIYLFLVSALGCIDFAKLFVPCQMDGHKEKCPRAETPPLPSPHTVLQVSRHLMHSTPAGSEYSQPTTFQQYNH